MIFNLAKKLCLGIIFITACMEGKPGQVIIIRHAEKPSSGENLSLKGKERAAALAPFFLGNKDLQTMGLPVAIYATKVSEKDKSHRTQETIAPLAKDLKLTVKADYIDTEYALAANEILSNPAYDGKLVLVCWEHHNIPAFAEALGVNVNLPKWPGDAFDQLWIVTFNPDDKIDFKIRMQALLYGDTPL